MAQWLRFEHGRLSEFGTVQDGVIRSFKATCSPAQSPPVVAFRSPCAPTHAVRSEQDDLPVEQFSRACGEARSDPPDEPLYLLKAPSAFLAHGDTIRRPKSYSGKVVYEGELGIVIGRHCSDVSESEARITFSDIPASMT